MKTYYFNIICEEISMTGGKVIHIDENKSSIEEVHELVSKNVIKFPNAKWEMYLMSIG